MIKPRGLAAAIDHALVAEDLEFARTRWSETLRSAPRTRLGGVPYRRRMVSSRVARVDQRAHIAFGPIQDIGGRTGWYGVDWFWSLRGLIDPRRGGPGFRRGRRHPHELQVGDPVDIWRVEHLEPGRQLLLAAEMRMPGRLWPNFEVEPDGDASTIRQTRSLTPPGTSDWPTGTSSIHSTTVSSPRCCAGTSAPL
jgi:hypothetical protein